MSATMPAPANAFPSRKRIVPFTLHRPATPAEAMEIYRAGNAAFYAGGVDMMNRLKSGRRIAHLVHLGGIAALREVERRGATLRLGSGLVQARAADALRVPLPDLAALLGRIANVRVRWTGTLGGNVMAAEPAYEVWPALAAAGARFVFADGNGERSVGAAECLGTDGLLLGFDLPVASTTRLLFERAHRPIAGVTIGVMTDGDTVTALRVAVSCAYDRPVCIEQSFAQGLERARVSSWAPGIAAACAAALPEPLTDWVAGGRYRRRLIGVIVQRLLATLEKRS